MKDLFFMGGPEFMGLLTVLLIAATAWIIYHFIKAYNANHADLEQCLRRIGYGKSIGLFSMTVGFLGQLIGLTSMFSAIAQIGEVSPQLVYGGIKVTLICPIYGILIYLFTLLLWFIASMVIEKKFE